MRQHDREQFRQLARAHRVVPVAREVVADLSTPVAAFLRLTGDGPGFLLESVEQERWSRWSFVGRRPLATLVARPGSPHLELDGELPAQVPLDRGILAALDGLLAELAAPRIADLPPLHGGVVGYLGYDVVREIERLPNPPADDQSLPDAVLTVVGQVAAFDHWRQRAVLIDNVFVPDGADQASDAELDDLHAAALARLDDLAAAGAGHLDEPIVEPPDGDEPPADVRSTFGGDRYERAVRAVKEHILAGDAFQVVVSQRFDVDLGADPFDVYRVLRQVNPSPYMYFLRHPAITLVGSSPEPLVRVRDGRVVSRPIAGTRRRGRTHEDDRRLAAELSEHPKERAEHVMLVDLARNDVGRVAEAGTVTVDELMVLERYSHVMHLTSEVSGALRPGLGPVDVLRATLPAGTVSGAPKVRAMELIDELEPTRRGPYAGLVGYVGFAGDVDAAIAIRTMVVRPDGTASVQAGAGVVADSEPADEDLECRNKARALLSCIPAARRMSAARAAGRDAAPAADAAPAPPEADPPHAPEAADVAR